MRTREGWYAVCALFCVYAHPARERANGIYISGSKSLGPGSLTGRYASEDVSRSSDDVEEEFGDFEVAPMTMKAITARASNAAIVPLPLILETEAEMLPPGYKGVKPPGVSHMEFVFTERRADPVARKNGAFGASTTDGRSGESDELERDTRYTPSKHQTRIIRDDRDSEGITAYERMLKGDSQKGDKKVNRAEAAGARKSHWKNGDRARYCKDGVTENEETTYEVGDGRRNAHNVARYRDVYHMDEKNADFYDDGRQGGRIEKRGRYGGEEKHVGAVRGTYKKGKSDGGGLDEFETNKRKKRQKTRAGREAQGHAMSDSSGTWADS